jgi:hypothetical protein
MRIRIPSTASGSRLSFVINLVFVLWCSSEEEVLNVHARLRLSGVERDTCLFVVANRQDREPQQNLLVGVGVLVRPSPPPPHPLPCLRKRCTLKRRAECEKLARF